MLAFDSKGFLTPPQPIPSTLEDMEKAFVEHISSQQRLGLFENYLRYLEDLQALIGNEFYQWVNGSFTTKMLEPKDIDLVNFVPYELVESLGSEASGFKYPDSLVKYNVDAYFVSVYEPGHRYYSHYKGNEAYWYSQFERTRPNRSGKSYKKGFLEIRF